MTTETPFFEDVQAHYDLNDEFFALFLDESRTYSCAYFEREDMSLHEAQLAKIDLSLGKLGLEPGMTLLDIGCGWGATMLRAADKYGVNVIGLTLSQNQHDHIQSLLAARGDASTTGEVRLQGWEEFDGKVDRIVSIGAFEHFRYERYEQFFNFAYNALPADGRMLLHTITAYGLNHVRETGNKFSKDDFAFMRFIANVIFPGGQLPLPKMVTDGATAAGFTVEKIQPLQLHYARTLDCWSKALGEHRDEAIALCGRENYNTYVKYLSGCAAAFRKDFIDVMQFTCVKG
ncbi:cyclopropane mycolic acid synthase family methyltransferase [Williamsia sp. CHRR-6]|uniref:cyclopropane mycolic acid synthase family methyltransferase n=1 Tax=Williamsia sp. CHRR-6 TaxID=2835871 RepID=UPI001BDB2FD6|nr:cyclopropane mycolic acid synthase family methyltransferase [Williamsia sp. CHRR-6]MBT0568440.1 class I SAM-dependent methyltransferase [Williamsia sp. CHRR-6]